MNVALLAPEAAELLMPSVPFTQQPELEGYVAITLDAAGGINLRGSRVMLAWLLEQLAARGWHIDLDQIRWCG